MIQFYMTEYEKDGEILDGPLIMAPNLEVATAQAYDLKLKLVGEMFPLMDITDFENRQVH